MRISGAIPERILRRMSPKERESLGKAGRTIEECQEALELKSEKDLQDLLATLLLQKSIPFCRQRMDKKSNVIVGWPDFTFCLRGRFCVWEVKHPNGKTQPDPEQYRILAEIKQAGGRIAIIRSYREALEFLLTDN